MINTLRLTPSRNLVAALVTWLVVSGLVVYATVGAAVPYSDRLGEAIVLMLLFLVAMLACCADRYVAYRVRFAALFVMLGAALTLGVMIPLDFLPIYTIIWISFTPAFMRMRWVNLCFVGVTAAWYAIELWAWESTSPLISVALFATFHYFALLSALQARRADEARARAESLNRELVATQHLLAEASRQGERTRIARDLHDLLGHHLTALTINLQVAERVAEGEAKSRIETCHTLAREMLGDVRAAVTTMRDESAVNFTESLQLIVNNIPELKIKLDMEPALRIDDVTVAESLLRCVQEAITNTLRHAQASECTIRVWRENGRLLARIHDNGRAPASLSPGNGLRGMRERVERLNGKLDISRLGDALRIDIQIPLASPA
ncbi:MAG: sensor histidine kinase [Pseudomonadota bacterium]